MVLTKKKALFFRVLLLIVVLTVSVFFVLTARHYFFVSRPKQNTGEYPVHIGQSPSATVPSDEDTAEKKTKTLSPSAQLQENVEFGKYQKELHGIVVNEDGARTYAFTDGQPKRGNNQKNYTMQIPRGWEIYRYTNGIDTDDYGTNIILKKGDDYIVIKQQLWEAGTCYFDNRTGEVGMAYKCDLIRTLPRKDVDWNVYTISKDPTSVARTSYPWVMYGVCDQNYYANEISSYTTSTGEDKTLCSPWTSIGEVAYYTLSKDTTNLNDFYTILNSIQINQ